MIHIEKLCSVAKGQTFVEYLNGVDASTDLSKKPWVYRNINLSKHINSLLPKHIKIGEYFGKKGIGIDQLLLSPPNIENLVIELPIDYLPAIPKQRLKMLLENFNVMLNDFEEFCTTYGLHRTHIVTYLTERNIRPKCLILTGAPFQMHSTYELLNIYTVPFEYWLLVTVSVQDFFLKAVLEDDHKQTLLSKIVQEPKQTCAVPMFKPRRHRIKLLSYLDKIGVLEKCDWSLAFNNSRRFNSYVLHHREELSANENPFEELTNDEINFLTKYNFPKELDFDEKWKLADSPYSLHPTISAPEWLNQYKFNLSSETYIGDEIEPIMGGCATVTEKTFKSFLYGSSPIIHGGKGSVEHITSLGFKTQFGNYDSSDVEELGRILLEIHDNPYVDKEMIVYNFNKITDLEFLTSLVLAPLKKIDILINSIRR